MKLWAPRVLGLDLSLTGTGIARIGEDSVQLCTTVRTGKLRGHQRLQHILDAIRDAQRGHDLDLVLVEGPSYGSAKKGQQGHHERAGLWWLVTHSLYAHGRPYAVVAPMQRALYATGRGGAGKADVLAAARDRYGHLAEIRDDNAGDALIIAAMGVEHLGGQLAGDVPDANKRALRKVQWPALLADDE